MIRAIGYQKDGELALLLRAYETVSEDSKLVQGAVAVLVNSLCATLSLMNVPGLQTDLQSKEIRIRCAAESAAVKSLFYQTMVGLICLEKEHPLCIEVRTVGFFRQEKPERKKR